MTNAIPKTEVIFILDGSGSMFSLAKETVSAYNEQLLTIKSLDNQDINVSIVSFNTNRTWHKERVNIKEITLLEDKEYRPQGGTALFDTLGFVCNKFRNIQTEAVLVYILTDGEENASREYTGEAIASLIKELQDTDKWTFVYVGATPNIVEIAKTLNIPSSNSAVYAASGDGMVMASAGMSNTTTSYFQSRSEGFTSRVNLTNTEELPANWQTKNSEK